MPQTKPQASMSFLQSRKAMLNTMTAKAKGGVQKKVIPFRNDDVPRFLQLLDDYETKSRQARLVVR